MLRHMNRKLRIVAGLLVLLAAGSGGVLFWTLEKMWAIGARADATGGDGGTDQILWLWLFLSLASAASSVITVSIILSRAGSQEHEAREKYSRSHGRT
jgi:hypothetical protein